MTWWIRKQTRWPYVAGLFLIVAGFGAAVLAADVRLKNGTLIRGNLLVGGAMADRFIGKGEMNEIRDEKPVGRTIARVDNGWQRYYFPVQQDARQGAVEIVRKPIVFKLGQPKQAKPYTVTGFGGVMFTGPFDEFGRRQVNIKVNGKVLNVVQGITEVSPDHVMVESLNYDWKQGVSLKTIPVETLDKMLRKQIKRDDFSARMALALFYAQAEYYPLAVEELVGIAKDFPDHKEQIEKTHAELMNFFGKEVLRRLQHRKRAGQHLLAEDFAKKLSSQALTGAVLQDVQQYVRNYEASRQSVERVKLMLGDWQSKLADPVKEKLVQPLRSELNEQLDFETLPRVDAFVKAEADKQYTPAQRLGLAYSGWVLGAANAVPDLDQALRAWDARSIVLQYLRSDDPSADAELMTKLKSTESIGPDAVLNLTAQLPPILDGSDVDPGKPSLVDTGPGKARYQVMLPSEYTSHHSYPMVVVLRPSHRSAEETLMAWAGEKTDTDLGFQRGYIVIAPEYAERNTSEYSFGAPVHEFVLNCLIDARKRFAVDSDRVFLAGHGMGGDAAYDIGMAHPDEFAGVLPLGGNAVNYCVYNWGNGAFTDWLALGKGYDVNGTRDITSNVVLDKIMKHGAKYDFTLVEYLGRNGEMLVEEIPKLYEWMDLHVRSQQPRQFKVCSLRRTDNRFFWVTAGGLPRDYILPVAAGQGKTISPMDIEVNASTANVIFLKSPTENYTLRLTPDLIDFEKRLIVRINGHLEFNEFVKKDVAPIVEELRSRGDRKRLPVVVLTP